MSHKSPHTKNARLSEQYNPDLKPLKRATNPLIEDEMAGHYEMNPDEVTYEGPAPNVVQHNAFNQTAEMMQRHFR